MGDFLALVAACTVRRIPEVMRFLCRLSILLLVGLSACTQPQTEPAPADMSMTGGNAAERQVWVSSLDRRFHRETCGFLGPDRKQIGVIEAMKFHTICTRCKPPTL